MKTKLIVGLGNPGDEHAGTYHNVGMMAVEDMVKKLEADGETIAWETHKDLFRYAKTDRAMFVIPLTFMNDAGRAVKEALKKAGAMPEELVVIHDESDLPVGDYKYSTDRGSAGHKGVQSIMDMLGSREFLRIRIGIRDPKEKMRKKAEEFVLAKIKTRDKKTFEEVFQKISAELLVS